MKALSLRQPWVDAILHLGKRLENRRWTTSFRGPFLIHAAKTMSRQDYDDCVDFSEDTLGAASFGRIDEVYHHGFKNYRRLPRFGGIVARAEVVGVIPPCAPAKGSAYLYTCPHLWHIPEQYGFVLANVEPLAFVPCLGSLGFFDVPDDVLSRLEVPHAPPPG